MKSFRRIRALGDRIVQFSALCYWNLIATEEECAGLREKDKREKEKGEK